MTFARAVTLLDTIPGVNQRGGELLVAEWGIDMGRFGTAARLAAWSGVAPGNDESAGKPEFAVYRHLRTRNPCIYGAYLLKRLEIHRYMNRKNRA